MDRRLLDKFYELNFGIYFDKVEDLGWAKIYTSDLILEEFNNHALIYSLEGNFNKKIELIEKNLLAKKRKFAMYVSDFTTPKGISENIKKSGFTLSFIDAWMFLKHGHLLPEQEDMNNIIPIGSNLKLFGEFERISLLSYSGEKTSENPYGGYSMRGFINAARRGLTDRSFTNRIEGYLLKYGGKFVSSALLVHDRESGYIRNVATLPKFRMRGFGKSISNYVSKKSRQLGLKTIYLATEKDSKNESFYSSIGYETKFTGSCYVKK